MLGTHKIGEAEKSASPLIVTFSRGLARLPSLNIPLVFNLGLAIGRLIPLVDLLLSSLASDSISFLYRSDQLLLLSVDHIKIVVGQFAPTLFYRPFHLLPFALHLIRVHLPSP